MGDDAAPVNEVSKEVTNNPQDASDAESADTQLSQEATSATDAASILRESVAKDSEVASSVLPETVLTGGVEESVQEKPQGNTEEAPGKPAEADASEDVRGLRDPEETSTQKHLELKTGEGDNPDAVSDALKEAGKDLVDPSETNTEKHLNFETGKGSEATESGDKPAEKPETAPADKELEAIKGNLLKIFDGKSDPQGLLEATRDLAKNSPDGNLRLKLTDGNSSSVITLQNSEIPGNRGRSNTTYKQMTHMYVSKDGGRTRVALRGVERNDNGKFDQQRDKRGNHVEYGGTGLNTMKELVQNVDDAKIEMTTKDGRKVEATFSKNDKGEVTVDVKEIKPEPKPEAVDRRNEFLQQIHDNPGEHLPNLTEKVDMDNPTADDVMKKTGMISALSDLGVQSIKVTPKGATEPITLRPVKIKGENGNPDTIYLGVDGEKGFAAKITPEGIAGMDPNKPREVFDKDVYSKINGLDWAGAKVEIDYSQLEDNSFVVAEKGNSVPGDQAVRNIRGNIPQGEIEAAKRTVNNAQAMERFMERSVPGYDFPEADNVEDLAKALMKPDSGFRRLDSSRGDRPQPGDVVLLAPNGKNEATKGMDATAGFIRADGNIVVPVGDGSKFESLGNPQQLEQNGFSGVVLRPTELSLRQDKPEERQQDIATDKPEERRQDVATDKPEERQQDVATDKPEDRQQDVDSGRRGNFDHLSVQEARQRLNTAFAKFMEANQARGGDVTGLNTARSAVGDVSGQSLDKVDSVAALETELPGRGFEQVAPKEARPGDLVIMQGKPPRADQVGIVTNEGAIQIDNRQESYGDITKGYDVRIYSPTKVANPDRARDQVQDKPQERAQDIPGAREATDKASDIVNPDETSTRKHLEFQTGDGTEQTQPAEASEAELEAQRAREQKLEEFREKGRVAIDLLFNGDENYEQKNTILHNMYNTGLREFEIARDGQPPYKVKLEKFQKTDGEALDPVRMSILRPGQDQYEPYLHAGGPTRDQTKYGKAYSTFDRNAIEGSDVEMRFEGGHTLDFKMNKPEEVASEPTEHRQDKPEEAPEISDVFKAPDKSKAAEHAQDAIRSLDGLISSGRFVRYGDLDAMAQSGINEVEFQNPDGSVKAAYKLSHKDGKYTLHNQDGERIYEIGTDPALKGDPSYVNPNYATYQFRSFSGIKMVAKFIDGSFHVQPMGEDPGRQKPKM